MYVTNFLEAVLVFDVAWFVINWHFIQLRWSSTIWTEWCVSFLTLHLLMLHLSSYSLLLAVSKYLTPLRKSIMLNVQFLQAGRALGGLSIGRCFIL